MPPKTKQRKDAPLYDPNLRDTTIQAGDYVLVQLANGDIRSVKLDPNSCVVISSLDHKKFHSPSELPTSINLGLSTPMNS